jgi:hypothetical protein
LSPRLSSIPPSSQKPALPHSLFTSQHACLISRFSGLDLPGSACRFTRSVYPSILRRMSPNDKPLILCINLINQVTCALSAIGATGCAATDAACICAATSFLASVQTCISTACSAADQQGTFKLHPYHPYLLSYLATQVSAILWHRHLHSRETTTNLYRQQPHSPSPSNSAFLVA